MDREPSGWPDRESRTLELAALLVALFTTLVGQSNRQLQAPDEMREAGISRAMARTGDVVTPRLNGTPFLEKPPLFHAVQAAVLKLTGSESRFAARCAAMLFALATLGATWLLARRLGGRRPAALAVLILATTAGFWSSSHGAITDDAVAPFVTLAFYFLLRAREPGAAPGLWLAAGFAAGFSFLAKGAPGPAIIGAGALAWLAVERDLRRILSRGPWLAAAGFAVPAGAWLAALWIREGRWAVEEVFRQNIMRASDRSADHGNPLWYYLKEMPIFFLPWTPFLLGGFLAAAPRKNRGSAPWLTRSKLPAAWFLAGLLLLSIVSAKRRVYLLPLAPAGAIVAASALDHFFFETRWKFARWAPALFAAAAIFALIGGSIFDVRLRPDDLPVVLASGTVAILGIITVALLAGRRDRLTAVGFFLIALAFAVGDRGGAPRENEQRGYEEFARETRTAIGDRPAVVFRPQKDESASEGLRGALTFYFDRDFPEAIGAEGLMAARQAAAGKELAVIACVAPAAIESILGPGRAAVVKNILRGQLVVVIYDAPR